MSDIEFPLQFTRQYSGPLDSTSVFDTYSDLVTYVNTNGTSYPGQLVTVLATSGTYVIGDDGSTILRIDTGEFFDSGLVSVDTLCATEIHTISSFTHYQDILVSELSGFNVTGDVSVNGGVGVTGLLSANKVNVVGGSSDQWNSTYSSVNTTSANWDSTYTTVSANSAAWGTGAGEAGSVYSTVQGNSANWDSVYTTTNANSADWTNTYTTVSANSAQWAIDTVYDDTPVTELQAASGNWNAAYSVTQGITGLNNYVEDTPNVHHTALIGGEGLSATGFGQDSFLGGGFLNRVESFASGIIGGEDNITSGDSSFLAGGSYNICDGYGSTIIGSNRSFIGNVNNSAIISTAGGTISGSANESIIIGGENNIIHQTGYIAAIVGGDRCEINKQYGLASGRKAIVNHNRARVFADGSDTEFTSISADEFAIQASGLRLDDGNQASGRVLTCDVSGTGTWQDANNFCDQVLYVNNLSACGSSNTISLTGDLDLNGGSLLNVGNNGITFESGASISSSGSTILIPGTLSASNLVSNTGFDSGAWDSTYTTVSANSAQWAIGTVYDDTPVTELQAASAEWDDTSTTVQTNSAAWASDLNVVSEFQASSGGWEDTKTAVQANSSTWAAHTDITVLQSASAEWDDTSSVVQTNSASWASGDTTIQNLSALGSHTAPNPLVIDLTQGLNVEGWLTANVSLQLSGAKAGESGLITLGNGNAHDGVGFTVDFYLDNTTSQTHAAGGHSVMAGDLADFATAPAAGEFNFGTIGWYYTGTEYLLYVSEVKPYTDSIEP